MYSLLLLLPTLYKVIQNELLLYYDQIAMILGHSALSLAISRAFGWVRRRTFLYEVLIRKQLETLGAVLFDLVPPHYAVQVLPPPPASLLLQLLAPSLASFISSSSLPLAATASANYMDVYIYILYR